MASAAAATAGDAPDAASARASRPSSPGQRVHKNSKQLSPGNVRRKVATVPPHVPYVFMTYVGVALLHKEHKRWLSMPFCIPHIYCLYCFTFLSYPVMWYVFIEDSCIMSLH